MNTTVTNKRLKGGLSALVLLACFAGWAVGGDPGQRLVETVKPFVPTAPTVTLRCEVVYRFMFIELFRVAEATIDTTKGLWRCPDGREVPVYLVEARLDTMEPEEERTDARLSLRDRLQAVLTQEGVDTLLYVRVADQYFNPMFGRRKRNHHMEVYDLASGELAYFHENYLTGEVVTNLDNHADLACQGREVGKLLTLMSQVYNGQTGHVDSATSPRIFVDIAGQVIPYAAESMFTECPIDLVPFDTRTLRVNIRSAPEATIRKGKMYMWATSLRELADALDNAALSQEAEKAPDWSMIPLMIDYDLAFGYIRGRLTNVTVTVDDNIFRSLKTPGKY